MEQNRRLIDADELISAIRDDSNINGAHFARMKQHIVNAQAVEVKPVRHGRWIEKPYLLGISHFCSLCGSNYGMPHEVYNFCPNCGARMQGGSDE